MKLMIGIILLTIVGLIILGLEVHCIRTFYERIKGLEYEAEELEDKKSSAEKDIEISIKNYERMQTVYRQLADEVHNYTKLKNHLQLEYKEETNKLNDFIQRLSDAYEREASNFSNKLEEAQKDYEASYLEAIKDTVKSFNEDSKNKKEEILKFQKQLEEYKSMVDAAVEAKKRDEEMESKQDFYRLQLSDQDIEEIKRLREASKEIRYPEAVNKVIYKVYYEKPYNALVGRVLGNRNICGIYKITNTLNGKCYVGQSVNVRDRWKQHIRRGVGADTPTRNKLYPIMLKDGVENFTFELVEEVPPEDLDKREDYWQEYFHAIDYGYSIK